MVFTPNHGCCNDVNVNDDYLYAVSDYILLYAIPQFIFCVLTSLHFIVLVEVLE